MTSPSLPSQSSIPTAINTRLACRARLPTFPVDHFVPWPVHRLFGLGRKRVTVACDRGQIEGARWVVYLSLLFTLFIRDALGPVGFVLRISCKIRHKPHLLYPVSPARAVRQHFAWVRSVFVLRLSVSIIWWDKHTHPSAICRQTHGCLNRVDIFLMLRWFCIFCCRRYFSVTVRCCRTLAAL